MKDLKGKIKIVEVIADSALGGGPKHLFGLLKHLNKEKFEPILIAPRGWLTSEAVKIKGVGVRIVDFKSKFDFRLITKLKKNIAEFRTSSDPFGPIIIHAHGPRAGNFCRMSLRQGEKFIYTEHIWNDDYLLKNRLNGFLQKFWLKFVCNKADLIIAVSNSVKKFLVKKLKQDKEKVVFIPNAVEIEKNDRNSHFLRLKRRLVGEFIVGNIGSLVPQKGQIYLIRAFKRVSASFTKAKLEIVGDGPSRKILAEEIKRLDLESKIQLLGRQKEIKRLLVNWDLFVLPSLSETFGLSVLDAMEVGVPVIASSVGGLPEIIKNGKSGVLVPPADPERLARAILWLLTEKKERDALSACASDSLKKTFDWSKIIVEIEEVYLSVIK